jgi:anti-sigma factor RsiW
MWSPMTAHEKFIELCAFATSGNLSQEEKRALREHLLICDECRQAMKQFEAAIDLGVPALAPELATKFPEYRRAGTAVCDRTP